MLCSVFFAMSTVKLMLVGPLNDGGTRGAEKGGLGRDRIEDVDGEGVTVCDGKGRLRSCMGARRKVSCRRAVMLVRRLSTCSCRRATWSVTCLNSSESLKLLVQQFGVYRHWRLRLPHRWQGVWPLHLIFRRLHSLL